MRFIAWIVLIGTLAYAAHVLALYALQGSILYQPASQLVATPADWGMAYEDVFLTTSDGVGIHGWHITRPRARGTVLFFHGNAGNISHRRSTVQRFRELGLDVFLIDYRGYGRSGGSPDESGTYRDARAAWDHLTDERGVPAGEIIVAGRSLGAAIAGWLAVRETPAGVVLESPFTSVPALAADLYPYVPARRLSRFEYPTLDYVEKMSRPLLLIHAREDRIVPFAHSERIYEAASEPRELVALDGGHNDGPFRSPEIYQGAWQRFVEQHLEPR